MKRPLLPVAALCTGGILCGEYLRLAPGVLLTASLAAALLGFLLTRMRGWILPALIFLVGWTDAVWHAAVLSPCDLRVLLRSQPAAAGLRGRLAAAPVEHIYARARSSVVIETTAISLGDQWQPAVGEVRAVVPAELPSEFFEGQTVEVWGAIAPPPGPFAEGLFNPREFYRRQGIYYSLETGGLGDWHVDGTPAPPPLSERFRRWADRTLARGLPNDEAQQLSRTLLLDWKTPLTPEAEEPFLRAGTFHIFAVDGLRIGLLAAILLGLLRLARLPRGICGWVVVPLLWFYAGLTGWPASGVRAAVMVTVIIAGWSLKRPVDLLNSLFAAALCILLWQPGQLFQPGFQLSFVVVLCLALIVPRLRAASHQLIFPRDPWLPASLQPEWPWALYKSTIYMTDVLIVSFAAWLASAPLCALYFHLFSPAGIIANCAVVPATALALIGGLASLLTGGWWPGLSVLFNNATWALLHFIIGCSRAAAHWPFGSWNLAAPSLLFSTGYYALLVAVVTGWIFRSRWKWAAWPAFACAAAFCLMQTIRQGQIARVHLLPLNGAAVVVTESPAAGTSLLDCGNETAAGEFLKPFLCAQGVNALDSLSLGVGRVEHCGGAQTILSSFAVESVFTAENPSRSIRYRQLIDSLKKDGRIQFTRDGMTAGGWTVLHPAAGDDFTQADDFSLVLRREFYGHSVLILPSLGRAGQDALLRRHPELRAEIVVAGLPARDEPLCDPLLERLRPGTVVIVDSNYPATRRASAGLRARLARRGVKTLYCRDTGALTLEMAPDGTARIHNWEIDF